MIKGKIYLAVLVVAVILTLFAGWYLWGPKPPKPETYAPAVTQADGSVVLERKPMNSKDIKSKQLIPSGGKVERVVEIKVQPEAKSGAPECPPVQVDMTVVRMKDDSKRVIASSPDGKILGGLDIPVEPSRSVDIPKWAAGLTANPMDRTYGVFLDRDIGPFRIGGEVNQTNGRGVDFRIKAGIRF